MSKSPSDSCEQPRAAGDGLPMEIWRQIHEHIPPTESARLYEVNRAFFRLEMSRNYDCIHLGGPLSQGRSDRWVYALRCPLSSKYIKNLTVWTSSLSTYLSVADTGSHQLSRAYPLQPIPDPTIQQLRQTFKDPLDLSSHLPALHSLTIVSETDRSHYRLYHRFSAIFKSPLQNAMQGIGQTLRVLKLFYTPLEFFRDGIISSNLHFSLLEEFHFNFFTIYRTTDYEDISQKCIAPFINRHSQTLKKLNVANRNVGNQPEYYYKPRRLFEHLTHIPGLAHLSIRLFLLLTEEASLDQLGRFIHAHSTSLSLLQLHLYHSDVPPRPLPPIGIGGDPQSELGLASFAPTYTPQTLFAHNIFSQALSSCRTLKTLQCMVLSEEALQSDATPFLQWFPTIKCADTLTSLFLLYNTLKQDDIIALISSVDLPGLRRLRVKVLAFNMTLFDALSSKLTGLQELTVWAFSLTCTLVAGIQVGWTPVCRLPEYSPFLTELRTRSYAHWGSLYDLFIPMIDGGHQQHVTQLGCDTEASIWQSWISEEQMRVAFPQIRRFDGGIRPFEML